MSSVLVTGINGFTGRYLAPELRRLGHAASGLWCNEGQTADECDLADRSTVFRIVREMQPELVVHLAAVAFVAAKDVEEIYRTNVVGTRNLLEALAGCTRKPSAVLLASSANVYGNSCVDPITESVAPAPGNDYAVSKLAMEHMARLWNRELPITIVRPFNYTGVGQSTDFLLPKIVDHFRRRAPEIRLGNLDVARDFSDVRTVVDAYARMLAKPAPGEAFNVCSGRSTSLEEILDLMARIAGYEIGVTVDAALVRDNEIKRLRGSNTKLLEHIGALAPIGLDETLRWMFEAKRQE